MLWPTPFLSQQYLHHITVSVRSVPIEERDEGNGCAWSITSSDKNHFSVQRSNIFVRVEVGEAGKRWHTARYKKTEKREECCNVYGRGES